MLLNDIATITVSSGLARLVCAKGVAELPLPIRGHSLFDNWTVVESAVSDLVFLAKPQKSKLIIVTPADDLAPVEAHCADELRHRSGAVEVAWRTEFMSNDIPLKNPHQEATESPGWVLKRAAKTLPIGRMRIGRGEILVEWQGMTVKEPIPIHSRLVVSDFTALANAVIRAKRTLSITHGVRIDVSSEAERELDALERMIATEAVEAAQLEPANPIRKVESPDPSWTTSTVGMILGLLVLLLTPYSTWLLGLVGLFIALEVIDILWQRRARARRLESLFVSHNHNLPENS